MRFSISLVAAGMLTAGQALAGNNVEAYVPAMKPLNFVQPVYPEAARAQRITGFVQILATIDPQGHVVEAEVLSGPELFRDAALDVIRKSMYRPILRNGRPVYALTDYIVNFFLPGEKPAPPEMAGMMAAAQRLSELRKQFPRDKAQELADTEQQSTGGSGFERFYALTQMAKAAIAAEDYAKAKNYADELLSMAPQFPNDWNYGNAIHTGNTVLGRIAIHNGDVPSARQYLLTAGHTPGSPQLNSFGPNMSLAKDLIAANERDTVLQYFELCRVFWKSHGEKLDEWSATVRGGGTPSFGANLLY